MTLSKEDREKLAALAQELPQNYKLLLTTEAREQITAVKADASRAGLEFQIKAAFTKLIHNPRHPGLNSHPFRSLSERYAQEIWESYVQNHTSGAWRIFWFYGPQKKEITVVLVTPHP